MTTVVTPYRDERVRGNGGPEPNASLLTQLDRLAASMTYSF